MIMNTIQAQLQLPLEADIQNRVLDGCRLHFWHLAVFLKAVGISAPTWRTIAGIPRLEAVYKMLFLSLFSCLRW